MSAEIISIAAVRGRLVPVVITPSSRPDEKIAAAADLSMLDHIRAAADLAMKHIEKTGQPLPPPSRVLIMKAHALIVGQP